MRAALLASVSALALLLATQDAGAIGFSRGAVMATNITLGNVQVVKVTKGAEQIWPADDGPVFEGGNQSHGSILEFVRYIADFAANEEPLVGGTLTINSGALGSYDVRITDGDLTISAFSAATYFTDTADSRSAIWVHKGNLTIDAGQTVIPAVRKLFLAIYVTGNLVVNGEISMSARGANHSASGGNVTANAIRIATGTFSSVTNPQVPAAGANGGAGVTLSGSGTALSEGNDGVNGTDGQTGGGGSGANRKSGSASYSLTSGAGRQGTGFGGGPGGGGIHRNTAGSAQAGGADGAKGGDADAQGGNVAAGGGAGNPGGNFALGTTEGTEANAGDNGTGGILFVFVEGGYSGSGAVTADGANGGDVVNPGNGAAGGGSGGGSVTIMVGGSDAGPSPVALGGDGGTSPGEATDGGKGGNGTARKLALAA